MRLHLRLTIFLAVIITVVFVGIRPASCQYENVARNEKRVSFEFHDKSMAEVAGLISKQLNYRVRMDDELAAVKITGRFNDVTLDEFFSRSIFRGKNIAILFDDDEHLVTIRSLGEKSSVTEYDRTNYTGVNTGIVEADPMDMEVQPGIKRRDVVPYVSKVDPMDMEVQPGVKRRDVVQSVSKTDPMDHFVQPGIKRRDVAPPPPPVDPDDVEIQPGIRRVDVAEVTVNTDPLDMEVQPGISRRDVLLNNNR